MAYEYSSESRRLDLANPFRVENTFLFTSGGLLGATGLFLLILSRDALAAHQGVWSLAPLMVGLALLVRGILQTAQAMRQLRFYFGRGQPSNLAGEIAAGAAGTGEGADVLRETLRQNALSYAEPQGALNGLLYSWIPDLIYAPAPVQQVTQRQFQTALALLATLLSWLISLASLSDPHASAWLGLFYFTFTSALLIRPLEAGAATRAQVGLRGLIGLIVLAIFGPVLIPLFSQHLPDIQWLALNLQAGLLLFTALVAVGLFFLALMRQMIAPPSTTNAREQQALSFNAHPKQLLDELDRLLQSNWSEGIPNRRYSLIEPAVGNGNGTFRAELLEETQPLPRQDLRQLDLSSTFAEPRYQWLGWLDFTALLLTTAGAITWLVFALTFAPDSQEATRDALVWASLGTALLIVAGFCFKAAHILWSRFDFESEMIWVEMSGNYQAANLEIGALLADRVKSKRQVINIESMTLRVWVTRLETVAFGKDSKRWLIGMRGLSDKARQYAMHVADFAAEQSIVVAPTASADLKKMAAMSAMNELSRNKTSTDTLPESARHAVLAAGAVAYCHTCGSSNDSDARFCWQCGTGVT